MVKVSGFDRRSANVRSANVRSANVASVNDLALRSLEERSIGNHLLNRICKFFARKYSILHDYRNSGIFKFPPSLGKISTTLQFSVRKMRTKNEIKHMIEHAIKFLILWMVYNWSFMIGVHHVVGKHVVFKYRTFSKIKYTESTCTQRNWLYMERNHVFSKGIWPFFDESFRYFWSWISRSKTV